MNTKFFIQILLMIFSVSLATAKLADNEKQSLFTEANEKFHQANSIADDPQARHDAYQQAILLYEKIITEGPVHNAKIYYNLGNAYFLKGELGQAILNYRKAQKLDGSDTNISKNLAFARSRKIDKFEQPTPERILSTLFFWHYDFFARTKLIISTALFIALSVSLVLLILYGRKSKMIIPSVILLIILSCFVSSMIIEQIISSSISQGVLIASSTIARQGDGLNYPQAFEQPLNEGTEFDVIEKRVGWLHIRLPDQTDCWIPSESAEMI